MLTSLVTIDRVDMCMKLCSVANKVQKTQIYIEQSTTLVYYAVCSLSVEFHDADAIIPVHEVRYGSSVRAPERLMDCINQTILNVIEQITTHPTIGGVVLCGFGQSAIVAYCASVCVQRILACSNLHATNFPNVHCVTFGLPLYYINPTHVITEQTHIIMHDDWYVLKPFTIVIKHVPCLCWIGTEDLVSYACNKIESIFHTVRSQRTMRDYINSFIVEYGELLTTYREVGLDPPHPSPSEESVDVDWVDCVEDSGECSDV
jgi:hypothetical protein